MTQVLLTALGSTSHSIGKLYPSLDLALKSEGVEVVNLRLSKDEIRKIDPQDVRFTIRNIAKIHQMSFDQTYFLGLCMGSGLILRTSDIDFDGEVHVAPGLGKPGSFADEYKSMNSVEKRVAISELTDRIAIREHSKTICIQGDRDTNAQLDFSVSAAIRLKAEYVGIEYGSHNLSERQDVISQYLGKLMGVELQLPSEVA